MAALIRRGLVEEGLVVDVSATGDDALWRADATEYDAIVLDVMLPGTDGFEVCRRLRERDTWAPVLMLTARGAVEDRVAGLDAGADDYLVKPFSFAELLARLRALARRQPLERPAVLEVGDLRLDPASRKVSRGETEIELSAKEFALLEAFMRRPGQVLSRLHLLEHAWDYAYENRSNVVDVYVRYLREKVDRPFGRDRSRPSAGPATGCARIAPAADEPAPDPAAADARIHAGAGRGARRHRRVPLLPARQLAHRVGRRGRADADGGAAAVGRRRPTGEPGGRRQRRGRRAPRPGARRAGADRRGDGRGSGIGRF